MSAGVGGGSWPDGAPVRRIARERVYRLTRELARRAGRDAAEVSLTDYEQARRDLTGEWERERQEAKLELIPDNEEADGPVGGDVSPLA